MTLGSMPMLRISSPAPAKRDLRCLIVLFKSALDRVRNSVVNADEPEKDGGRNLAYGLYVLARNGTAPIGDLRYLADTKLEQSGDPDRQVATGRGTGAGRRSGARAEKVYAAALESLSPKPTLIEFGRTDYGSALPRCRGIGLACQRRQCADPRPLTQAVQRVEAARGLTPYTSTQENAWLVLASRALAKETLAHRCRRRAG